MTMCNATNPKAIIISPEESEYLTRINHSATLNEFLCALLDVQDICLLTCLPNKLK